MAGVLRTSYCFPCRLFEVGSIGRLEKAFIINNKIIIIIIIITLLL